MLSQVVSTVSTNGRQLGGVLPLVPFVHPLAPFVLPLAPFVLPLAPFVLPRTCSPPQLPHSSGSQRHRNLTGARLLGERRITHGYLHVFNLIGDPATTFGGILHVPNWRPFEFLSGQIFVFIDTEFVKILEVWVKLESFSFFAATETQFFDMRSLRAKCAQ